MQFIFILVSFLLVLGQTFVYGSDPKLVSMEIESIANIPFGNDRFDNPYHIKTEFMNNNKEKIVLINRRLSAYPLVEVGPGSFKAEYEKLPPDYLVNQFKKLLALKKKMAENED